MSDFLMNLARRAVGDDANGIAIAPSPAAALAERMALPTGITPEPAPPAITAVAPAAAAPLMREVAPVSPPVAPSPPPAAVRLPAAPPGASPEIPAPSVAAPLLRIAPASAEASETASPRPAALPQDSDRSADVATADAARIEPQRSQVSVPANLVSPRPAERSTEVVVRVEPSPPAEPSAVVPAQTTATHETPLTLAPRDNARSPAKSSAASSHERVRAEPAPIDRARVGPRLDRPADTVVLSARQEAPVSALSTDTGAVRQRAGAAARRPIDVRIASIQVYVTSPDPSAPSERPALAGFEEYAAVRNHRGYDGE